MAPRIARYNPINPGDTVALIAPSSPLPNQKDLPAVVKACEDFGLKVKQYPSVELRADYVAGTGKQRAADMMKAIRDPKISAVLCTRGGYGAAHMLPYLDWKEIAKSRKLFSGFSDITALLTPMYSLSKFSGLHAPTMGYFRENDEKTAHCREALKKFFFEGIQPTSYREMCGTYFKPQILRKGRAKGTLLGGNLSVFVTMIGTPYMPKAKNVILFIEDVGEKPYKLDRFVTHLIQSGYMNNVKGVVLGQFTDCNPTGSDRLDAANVFANVLGPLKIPILSNIPIGHDRPSYPLPIGVEAELDAVKGDLILEG